MKKILILFAHPSPHRSEVNIPLVKEAQQHEAVTLVDLYAEYPTYAIDIEKEQQRLLEHDVVIFMFPLYWYSAPSLLKEWQDLVFEYGFAYGSNGNALERKLFFCAITAGASEKGYQHGGYNHFTIRDLFQPFEQIGWITKMHYMPPFVLFGSRTAMEEKRLDDHINQWQTLLQCLASEQVDATKSLEYPTLNEYLKEALS